jgi:hypothetical protein
LLAKVVEVNSLRVFKPSGAISSVLRDQKAERAIKAIMLLNNMRSQFGGEKQQIGAIASGAADFQVKQTTPTTPHVASTVLRHFSLAASLARRFRWRLLDSVLCCLVLFCVRLF